MSFVHHESILKAPYKFGLNATFLSAVSESSKLSKQLADAMNGKRGKEDEFEMIKTLARLEIVMSQIVYFMNLKQDVDRQIVIELEGLTDRVLTKGSIREK